MRVVNSGVTDWRCHREKLNERNLDYAGDCRRMDIVAGLHSAQTRGVHLTERLLSGDRQK